MRRLIAEIGNANGSLDYALEAVDEFAKAGAWAIKGQLYRADTLVTKTAPTYGTGLREPATQYEAFTNALSYDDWYVVADRCADVGVGFFGSVFDHSAVSTGVAQGWEAFKIASADITNKPLLETVARTGRHVFLSTGAATAWEIARAYSLFHPDQITLLACTLAYPCNLMHADVDRMETLAGVCGSVGYSDHTRGLAAADYAFRSGAEYVEKHVTLTPGAGGDHDFAVTPDMVNMLVTGQVPSDPVLDALVAGDSDIYPRQVEYKARRLARRTPYATVDIQAGEKVTFDNTIMLRPSEGVDPFDLPKTALLDIRRGHVIHDGIVR